MASSTLINDGLKKLLIILIALFFIVSLIVSVNLYYQNKKLLKNQRKYIFNEKKYLNKINILKSSKGNEQKLSKEEPTKSENNISENTPYYKNENFAYIVNYPNNWTKTESVKKDGITLQKNSQKIIINGINDVRHDRNIEKYLDSEYGDSILSKERVQAVNADGWVVSTEMEQFAIFQSWKNFVIIYTELPANEKTITSIENIAKSFQVLGE